MKLIILIIFSITLSFHLGAQSAFDLENWNTENSPLGSNTIQTMIFDQNGALWIATDNGLFTKNGVDWTVYNTSNTDFPSNAIRSIAFDSANNPAVGFFDHGFSLYDGENWVLYNKDNSALPDNFVKFLKYDLNGALWISTTGGLVKKMNNDWTMWDSYNSIAWSNNFTKIVVDPTNNNKYVGSINGGFLVFIDDTLHSVEISYTHNISDNTIHDILIRPNGELWCASPSGGLQMRFGYNIWAWFNSENSALPSSSFNALIGTDLIYLSSHDQGLVIMDGDNFITINMNNSNLPTNYIVSVLLAEDEEVLWIATNSHGLFKLDLRTVSLSQNSSIENAFYPNPNDGILNFRTPVSEISIRNALGQIVYEYSGFDVNLIDIESLYHGLYWIEIDGMPSQKIIKR